MEVGGLAGKESLVALGSCMSSEYAVRVFAATKPAPRIWLPKCVRLAVLVSFERKLIRDRRVNRISELV
jgi:hypothetical protein